MNNLDIIISGKIQLIKEFKNNKINEKALY